MVSEPPHPQAEEHDHQQHRADARPVDPNPEPKKNTTASPRKRADLSRPIADAALGWDAAVGVRINSGVTTGATCFRSGHHDAGGMLRRAERVAGSGNEVGDVAAADKPEPR